MAAMERRSIWVGAQGSPTLAELREVCSSNFADVMVRSFKYESGHFAWVDCSQSDEKNLYSLLRSNGYMGRKRQALEPDDYDLRLHLKKLLVSLQEIAWLTLL